MGEAFRPEGIKHLTECDRLKGKVAGTVWEWNFRNSPRYISDKIFPPSPCCFWFIFVCARLTSNNDLQQMLRTAFIFPQKGCQHFFSELENLNWIDIIIAQTNSGWKARNIEKKKEIRARRISDQRLALDVNVKHKVKNSIKSSVGHEWLDGKWNFPDSIWIIIAGFRENSSRWCLRARLDRSCRAYAANLLTSLCLFASWLFRCRLKSLSSVALSR